LYNNVKCGMYCTHTPGDSHVKWQERKNSWKKGSKANSDTAAPSDSAKPTADSKSSNAKPTTQLALSKSLQAALMTKAGVTADQFQQIWNDACDELGN
jgi:hypothetical protein